MFGKRKLAALLAEFLGAGVLTLLVLSVQRSTIGVPFFVAAAAGLTVALMMVVLADASMGQFNPAITLGLWTVRKVSTARAILYIVVQLLGGWAAYGLYRYFANSSLQSIGGHYTGRILVAESVGTAIFAFGYASAVYQKLSPAVRASFTGLAFMLGIIAASSAAIGLLNPAVALGTRAWVISPWTGGAYVLGPIIGALVGINLYDLLFAKSGSSPVFDAVTQAVKTSSSSKKK